MVASRMWLLATALCAAAVTWLSLLPGSEGPSKLFLLFPHIDLAGHLGFYFALCWAALRALHTRPTVIALAACLYGGLMEWLQQFIPLRDPSIADACVNAIGAALALAITLWRRKTP